jgi:RNA polymerase sigma factor (TIGR02999 family)
MRSSDSRNPAKLLLDFSASRRRSWTGMADPDVTALVRAWSNGDPDALEQVLPIVYDQLRRLAGSYMRGERPGHTLRPTELVAEAYLRLADGDAPAVTDRVHFVAIAARTMRRVLVDHANARNAAKRGGGQRGVTFDEGLFACDRPDELVALDQALSDLEAFDPRAARVVELHYFGGMTRDDVATLLGVTTRTVARDLRAAQGWIRTRLEQAP